MDGAKVKFLLNPALFDPTNNNTTTIHIPQEIESTLIQELDLLRKDPTVFATYIRSNRQNLYKGIVVIYSTNIVYNINILKKGTQIELLKDDLKTKVYVLYFF